MNTVWLDQLVNAVLYEGYVLYPYRPFSTKNARGRFTFGRVYPEAYSVAQNGAETCQMQTECLVQRATEGAAIEVTIRFLHPTSREVGLLPSPLRQLPKGEIPAHRVVQELSVGGTRYQSWQEAVEREVKLSPLSLRGGQRSSVIHPFAFSPLHTTEPIIDASGCVVGIILRRQEALEGTLEFSARSVADGCFKITVRVLNQTSLPNEAEDPAAVTMRTFASTHTILSATRAEFISSTEPSAEFRKLAGSCRNIGTWPVLVGDGQNGERDTMLSSPIILSDYPQIAAESGGDNGEATESDQMRALRAMTLTSEEKRVAIDFMAQSPQAGPC